MSRMNAWLLDLGASRRAAVGTRELLHLIDAPVTFEIPCTPTYCQRVVFWQDRMLPVMDIAAKLGALPQQTPFLAVVGYQRQRGEYPQFGALMLASPPQQIEVSDEQACSMPEEKRDWKKLAISCFDHRGDATPVLNLNLIFSSLPASDSQDVYDMAGVGASALNATQG